MAEEEIIEEFGRLQRSATRSKSARLRDLYDHIEVLRSRGFTHAAIVNAMKKHGLEFDLKTFEVTFYRIKRERAKSLAQLDERPLGAKSEERAANKQTATKSTKDSSKLRALKVSRQATQEELKAIARGHIDPSQFIEE